MEVAHFRPHINHHHIHFIEMKSVNVAKELKSSNLDFAAMTFKSPVDNLQNIKKFLNAPMLTILLFHLFGVEHGLNKFGA